MSDACHSAVYVVTAADGSELAGCLVGFASQCSIDPPRYVVCLSKQNRTYDVASKGTALVVHVLHRTRADFDLAELFGEQSGYELDKFDRYTWEAGPDGVPVLQGCDWFGGPIVQRFDAGDHVGFVVTVTAGRGDRLEEECLTYGDVRDLRPGNPP